MTTLATPHPYARRATGLAVVTAFAAVYLFWGMTFLAIRYAVLDGMPPLIVIGIRCVVGAAILYTWLMARGELRPSNAAEWRTAAIAGVFLFVGGHAVMAWAEQRVDSGETALLMTTIPLWLVLLTSIVRREMPSGRVMSGLAVGTAGVAVLSAGGAWTGGGLDRIALLACAVSWAIGSVIARDGARPASAIQSTAMQLAAGGVVIAALALATGDLARWDPMTTTPRAAGAMVFLVIGGTALGFAAYTWLMRTTTPAAAGSFAFVNPVVALVLAWAVGDATMTGGTIAAAALVLSSVGLTRR